MTCADLKAVAVVFAGLLVVALLLGLLVLPPAVKGGTALMQNAPDYVDRLLGMGAAPRQN